MDKVSKHIATGFMGLFLSMMLFLSGCQFSLISPESAFEETQAALQGIDNVEIKYREEFAGEVFRGRYLLDINRNEKWIELSEDNAIMNITNDDVFIQFDDMPVEQWNDTMLAWEFEEMIALLTDPYGELSLYDHDIVDKFNLVEEPEEITLSYDSEDSGMNRLAKNYLFYYVLSAEYLEEMEKHARNITIHDFSFNIILDAASYLPKQLLVKIVYEDDAEDPGEKISVRNTYTYKNYDQVEEIQSLQMSAKDQVDLDEIEELEQQSEDVKEQMDVTPEDAASYIEALIYASVYQDVDEYVKRDPSDRSNKEKSKDGREHRDTLQSFYTDIITEFIIDTGVQDADADGWTEAVFAGLANTTFDVIHTQEVGENEFIVTLSVSGIDEEQIFMNTVEEMEKSEEGIITADRFERVDMAILKQQYKNSDTLDPVEVDILVVADENGAFLTSSYDIPVTGAFIQ